MKLNRRRLFETLVFLSALSVLCLAVSPKGLPPATYDYREARSQRATQLRAPGPAPAPRLSPPPTDLSYTSAGRTLRVWEARPSHPGPHPVIIYLHGGAALEASEWAAVQAFVSAGYAVIAPTWRGESGNPGHYELCYGEVDDAIAAVHWAAQRDGLDATRMFAFGHQTGGVMVGFLAMHDELPLLATASVNAMYLHDDLDDLGVPLPFVDTHWEREMRVFPPFLGQPVLPHIGYASLQNPFMVEKLNRAAERGGLRVNLFWLEDVAEDALKTSIHAFIRQIGDD